MFAHSLFSPRPPGRRCPGWKTSCRFMPETDEPWDVSGFWLAMIISSTMWAFNGGCVTAYRRRSKQLSACVAWLQGLWPSAQLPDTHPIPDAQPREIDSNQESMAPEGVWSSPVHGDLL